MLKFIEIPVLWADEKTLEMKEELGLDIEPEYTEETLHVIPSHICAINESSETGCSSLRLSSGDVFRCRATVGQLVKFIKENS